MHGEKCPQCGELMDFYEKDTSSGRDMRTYHCKPCDKYVDVEHGVATWKVLSDAAESRSGREADAGARLLGVRFEPDWGDGIRWAFYLINDTPDPIRELVLEDVGYEWGDMGNSRRVDQALGPVPAREFVLAWRDDSDGAELRMDLRFRVKSGRGEETLLFEVPKLYRRTQEEIAPLLGKALFVGRPGPAPAERAPATLSPLPDPAPAPFPPPSATDEEVSRDLAVQRELLEYARRIFGGEKPEPAFEARSLADDLRCNNLNLAYVLLVIFLEQSMPAERAIAAMSDDLLAVNLGRLAKGIVAFYQKLPSLSESQCSAMMRDGSFAYRALLAPPRARTVGAALDYARAIVARERAEPRRT